MNTLLATGRVAAITILMAAISACSSTPNDREIAESFASQRAEMLNKIVPVNMNGYNLISAKSRSTEIELTLLYSGKGNITPDTLADSLQQSYCSDNEISSLMAKGVSYRLQFREARGRVVLDRTITNADCLAKPKLHQEAAAQPNLMISPAIMPANNAIKAQ